MSATQARIGSLSVAMYRHRQVAPITAYRGSHRPYCVSQWPRRPPMSPDWCVLHSVRKLSAQAYAPIHVSRVDAPEGR